MKYNRQTRSEGFTLIELLIATTVFSVILLVIATGIIQIGNGYYKASLMARTQAATRNIMDEVSRGLQFSGSAYSGTSVTVGTGYHCLNGVRYNYGMQNPVTTSYRALVADVAPNPCSANSSLLTGSPSAGQRSLVPENMRLQKFTIVENATNHSFTITVKIIAAADTGLIANPTNANDSTCKGGIGSQFCAVSELSTTIQRRIN